MVVAQTTRSTLKHAKEVKEEEGLPELLGMCQMSFDRLMTMCGLTSGEEGDIPQLWSKLSSKKMKAPMKKSIIKQWIREHKCFPDSKVVLYAPLLTVILTCDFEEETSRSLLKSAAALELKQFDTVYEFMKTTRVHDF